MTDLASAAVGAAARAREKTAAMAELRPRERIQETRRAIRPEFMLPPSPS